MLAPPQLVLGDVTRCILALLQRNEENERTADHNKLSAGVFVSALHSHLESHALNSLFLPYRCYFIYMHRGCTHKSRIYKSVSLRKSRVAFSHHFSQRRRIIKPIVTEAESKLNTGVSATETRGSFSDQLALEVEGRL